MSLKANTSITLTLALAWLLGNLEPAAAQLKAGEPIVVAQGDAPPVSRRRPGEEGEADDSMTEQSEPVRRRRPGEVGIQNRRRQEVAQERAQREVMPLQHSAIPRPDLEDFQSLIPVPDRWRIVDTLYASNLWDPYNRNLLKGDTPIYKGDDWFLVLTGISDSLLEIRNIPTPVGVQTSKRPDSLNFFGRSDQLMFIQQFALNMSYIKGDTVFRPPDYEIRITPVFNYNYTVAEEIGVLNVDPREGTTRNDWHATLQAAFLDYHIRNVSPYYDFDSIRVGIQPFNVDFRGFLFTDSALGVRLFGTRKNNIFSYNLAWFRRFDKDINSGLNDLSAGLREDDVFLANLYWQDMPVLGYTSQFSVIYNRNRDNNGVVFDSNGFIARPSSLGTERPRTYDVVYFGFNGDGHFGRLNLTHSFYYATGEVKNGTFTNKPSDISAWFGALEASVDFDWQRYSLSFLYGSGDDDPFDNDSEAFDAIFENPLFAGADASFWIRQAVPFIGGGQVALSGRNGILNSLRSSKELGQSNFTNPGIILLGAGADFEILPELRLSLNANYLWFDETQVLEVARQQAGIDSEIGLDFSVSVIYRPLMSQNIVLRASYAALFAGEGYQDLFPTSDLPQSLLASITLKY